MPGVRVGRARHVAKPPARRRRTLYDPARHAQPARVSAMNEEPAACLPLAAIEV